MPRVLWATCFWPGLAPMWVRGSGFGLLVALLFSVLINTCIITSFVWTEWLNPSLQSFLWILTSGIYFGSTIASGYWLRQQESDVRLARTQGLYEKGVSEYLQGNWYSTETILTELLNRDPYDLEAMLMIACLYRRTERFAEGFRYLDRCQSCDTQEKWTFEIDTERVLIQEDITELEEFDSETSDFDQPVKTEHDPVSDLQSVQCDIEEEPWQEPTRFTENKNERYAIIERKE